MKKSTKSKSPSLGNALRTIRRDEGLTLAQVSSRTGIPVSTLSKVENDVLSLSYSKLLQISYGLNVDITRLFTPPDSASAELRAGRRSVNKLGSGEIVETERYVHTYLSVDLRMKQMDPIVAELKARTLEEFGPLIQHPGEEFALVLEGKVLLHTEFYEPLLLSKGESIYFDSSMGHAYLAASKGRCRVLSICTCGKAAIMKAFDVNMEEVS